MGRKSLTDKQRSFLDYIREHVKKAGEWPTYREIVDHFDFRSPNSVTQNLQALWKKGFLERDDDGYQLITAVDDNRPWTGIPILGTITAGGLQEAVESSSGTITLEHLFPQLDRMFAIKVSGNSMIDEGIQDGDFVLLVDGDIPNGGIGAVMYRGETTLKRVFKTDDGVRLEAANPEYDDINISPDVFEEVTTIGRIVGHMDASGIYKKTG